MTNGTLQGSASVAGGAGINGYITHNATVPFKYYPGMCFISCPQKFSISGNNIEL